MQLVGQLASGFGGENMLQRNEELSNDLFDPEVQRKISENIRYLN